MRLQAVSDESALYESPTLYHFSPDQENTIRHYKKSGPVKRTPRFGRNIEPDSESKARSRKGYERLGRVGVFHRGTEKTHFQHLVIATAINLVRTLAWLEGEPLAKTRTSKFAALAA